MIIAENEGFINGENRRKQRFFTCFLTESGKPLLHCVKNLYQLGILYYIGNHCIHIAEEGAAEYSVLIRELLKAVKDFRGDGFHTGTAPHDPDFADQRRG